MTLSTIGERLRALREAAGVSAIRLSSAIGASHAVVGNIERGAAASPSAAVAARLARTLGTTVDYLVLGEGHPPSADEVRAAWERASATLKATGTDD
jgi:transcriptional regulator with XRE-family HTH domain